MKSERPDFHKNKIASKILDDLNYFLRFSLNDPRLKCVSVTRVDLQDNYSCVRVYWDTFDYDKCQEAQTAMWGVRGKLRGLLSQALKIKRVPKLMVYYDSQWREEQRMRELLDQ